MAGCKCAKNQKRYDPNTDFGDMPPTDLSKIKDPLERFEKEFPFHRMHVTRFVQKVNALGKHDVEIELLS
jgi:hypothetical protein